MTGEVFEFREIDAVLVVDKREPQRTFEHLGRCGAADPSIQELANCFRRDWLPTAGASGATPKRYSGAATRERRRMDHANLPATHPAARRSGVTSRLGRRLADGREIESRSLARRRFP
jgi:hypothetical protein